MKRGKLHRKANKGKKIIYFSLPLITTDKDFLLYCNTFAVLLRTFSRINFAKTNSKKLSDSRHLWIPISFENEKPILRK